MLVAPRAPLVPKLQLGNAVLEALLRRAAAQQDRAGKRSFQEVRSQAGAWERGSLGTRELGNEGVAWDRLGFDRFDNVTSSR